MIGVGSDKNERKKYFHSFLAFFQGHAIIFENVSKDSGLKVFLCEITVSICHSFVLFMLFLQTVLASRKLNGSSFRKEVVDRNLSRSVKVWMLSRKTALPLAFSLSKPHFAPFHISTLATLHINKAGFSKATYLAEHYFMFTKKDLFGCETVMSI